MKKEEFVLKANTKHNHKYDYSKVEYVDYKTKVCIICPKHGEFWQNPSDHLQGKGCNKCNGGVRSNTKDFIEKAKKIHGNKYDYSEVEYVHNAHKVSIICPIHGVFKQSPNNHLHGDGCPKCTVSKIEEGLMRELDALNVEYVYQKRFSWLGKQSLDFYLPEYNIAIECQGQQHYRPISFSKTIVANISLQENIKRDIKKFNKCVEHNIMLYYLFNEGESMPQTLIYNSDNFCYIEKLIKIIECLKKSNE